MLDLLLTKCLIPRDKKKKTKNQKKKKTKKNISLGREANWVQYHTMYKLKTSCQVTLKGYLAYWLIHWPFNTKIWLLILPFSC